MGQRIDRSIFLTEHDHSRLLTLLDVALNSAHADMRTDLRQLSDELAVAQIVPSEKVPADIVTLNSQVRVEHLDDKEETIWLLTFPQQANIQEHKLSVLSPVGTALLGARKGEVVEWHGHAGGGRLLVKEILFQPEAAGRFDL